MDSQSANTERLVAYLNSLGSEEAAAPTRVAEYIWALIALCLFSAWIESNSFPVEQAVAQEARGCIAQYGPGEYHRNPDFKCAPMVEAPSNALSFPLAENK